MATLLIRGEGLAGSCCAHLLRGVQMDVTVETKARQKLPAIMVGDSTQKLLREVFGRGDLFAGFPQIRKRVVLWGKDRELVTLPHAAVVVSEKELLGRLQQRLGDCAQGNLRQPDWTIFASNPLPPDSVEHQFGSRPAAASAVTCVQGCDAEACWIESVENGWLFLLPGAEGTGWLLSVGDILESLLAQSWLIKKQISDVVPPRGTFLAHPRIAFPLSAPGWLACGTAALAFDPLCGDGAGNAVREAILASAMVRAIIEGGDSVNLIAHYQARLLAGFQRHLALCFNFYKSGLTGPWWERQLDDLERGMAWCSERLEHMSPSRYRLKGFTLEAVE